MKDGLCTRRDWRISQTPYDTQQIQIRITVVNVMANLAAEIATGA